MRIVKPTAEQIEARIKKLKEMRSRKTEAKPFDIKSLLEKMAVKKQETSKR